MNHVVFLDMSLYQVDSFDSKFKRYFPILLRINDRFMLHTTSINTKLLNWYIERKAFIIRHNMNPNMITWEFRKVLT